MEILTAVKWNVSMATIIYNPLVSVFLNNTHIFRMKNGVAFIGFQTDYTEIRRMNGFFLSKSGKN